MVGHDAPPCGSAFIIFSKDPQISNLANSMAQNFDFRTNVHKLGESLVLLKPLVERLTRLSYYDCPDVFISQSMNYKKAHELKSSGQ